MLDALSARFEFLGITSLEYEEVLENAVEAALAETQKPTARFDNFALCERLLGKYASSKVKYAYEEGEEEGVPKGSTKRCAHLEIDGSDHKVILKATKGFISGLRNYCSKGLPPVFYSCYKRRLEMKGSGIPCVILVQENSEDAKGVLGWNRTGFSDAGDNEFFVVLPRASPGCVVAHEFLRVLYLILHNEVGIPRFILADDDIVGYLRYYPEDKTSVTVKSEASVPDMVRALGDFDNECSSVSKNPIEPYVVAFNRARNVEYMKGRTDKDNKPCWSITADSFLLIKHNDIITHKPFCSEAQLFLTTEEHKKLRDRGEEDVKITSDATLPRKAVYSQFEDYFMHMLLAKRYGGNKPVTCVLKNVYLVKKSSRGNTETQKVEGMKNEVMYTHARLLSRRFPSESLEEDSGGMKMLRDTISYVRRIVSGDSVSSEEQVREQQEREGREQRAREQQAREERERRAREQMREQQAREEREQRAREQAREESEQRAREQQAREERERRAREQMREQQAREREQRAREQAREERERREQWVREQHEQQVRDERERRAREQEQHLRAHLFGNRHAVERTRTPQWAPSHHREPSPPARFAYHHAASHSPQRSYSTTCYNQRRAASARGLCRGDLRGMSVSQLREEVRDRGLDVRTNTGGWEGRTKEDIIDDMLAAGDSYDSDSDDCW